MPLVVGRRAAAQRDHVTRPGNSRPGPLNVTGPAKSEEIKQTSNIVFSTYSFGAAPVCWAIPGITQGTASTHRNGAAVMVNRLTVCLGLDTEADFLPIRLILFRWNQPSVTPSATALLQGTISLQAETYDVGFLANAEILADDVYTWQNTAKGYAVGVAPDGMRMSPQYAVVAKKPVYQLYSSSNAGSIAEGQVYIWVYAPGATGDCEATFNFTDL